ncbi:MAG: non-ribosomal peptide synthetase [Verrucomicrobia bacterium]|nr:non-ribosomal peptide synthetase [Verrucomicrobiota bacterium]
MNQKSQQHITRTKCYLKNVPRLEFTENAATTKSICTRFDEVVKRFPQNVALKSRSSELTYTELDSQSNGVAQLLLRLGLGHTERIGLFFEHSVLAVVAQIGVLKAGSTRVELDISYPIHRLQQIIEHCKIRYIITRTGNLQLAEKLVNENTVIINLEDKEIALYGDNPHLLLHPGTPATISYSSGSTGQPKQTIRDHVNELHAAMRVTDSIGLNSQDRMLFTRSSTAIPLHALLHGACYYPTDLQHDGNLVSLADWIRDEQITVYRSPVSTFRALTGSLRDTDKFPDLRLIVLQGEPVFRADIEAFKKRFADHCVLVSSLGVSEFGDFAHYLVDKTTVITTPTVPGGYALTGTQVVILNKDSSRNDESGEIGIRGSFISNSSSSRFAHRAETHCEGPNIATYATGDICEIASDGCIYHSGRKDLQVKIRGNRVDLLEVEAALLDLDGISQVAAAGHADSNGDVSLVAYIESISIDTQTIREKLKVRLPSYMVPTILMCLTTLPRTLTGKIDRQSLPTPAVVVPVAPVEAEVRDNTKLTKTTDNITAIWKEVLQLDQIGLNDHFMDVGGDSLKAMMILARVNHKFDVNLTIRMLFDAGTILLVTDLVESLISAQSTSPPTSSSVDTSK